MWPQRTQTYFKKSFTSCNKVPKGNTLLFRFGSLLDIEEVRLISPFWQALRHCGVHKPQEIKNSLEINPVAKSYADIRLAIMGNFSYGSTRSKLYDNGRTIDTGESYMEHDIFMNIFPTFTPSDASAALYYAVVTTHPSSTTCNFLHVDTRVPRYSNTWNCSTYLINMWLVLIICTLTLVLILYKISGATSLLSITQSTLVPVKLLLEQGNPFPDSLIKNHRGQFLFGAVLLMGIILTNVYKNSNVYKMFVRRKNIPYQCSICMN